MDCPACGQKNDQGMQFCIFCGQALSAEAAPAASGFCCQSCGKSDPLNGKYCVFCGGNMANSAKPAVAISQSLPAAKVTSSGKDFLFLALALILGAGAAFLLFQTALVSHLQKSFVQPLWTKDGLVLYASAPEANLFIKSLDQKTFLCGKTGKDGAIAINNLAPGSYNLQLSGKNHQYLSEDFTVGLGQPTILGYPQRLELE
ncbi:MAG: zinc ribbon domain-containing protein [Candidatus Obscuribacterales bacterium]|nr:zinc ribbon domain-containing protein [Candidatus Obscuribacterales bacterium]